MLGNIIFQTADRAETFWKEITSISCYIKFFQKYALKKYGLDFFFKEPPTHVMSRIWKIAGKWFVRSAELALCIMPLNKFPRHQLLEFQIMDDIQESDLLKLIEQQVLKDTGDSYNIWQLPFYIVVWACEHIGINAQKWKTWSPNGPVCSKTFWRDAMERFEKSPNNPRIKELVKYLNDNFTENTIRPIDLFE